MSSLDVRKQVDWTTDVSLMFARVLFASLQFGIFAWVRSLRPRRARPLTAGGKRAILQACFYRSFHVRSALGRAVEHAPDVVLLACGAYFLFAAALDYGRLFLSPVRAFVAALSACCRRQVSSSAVKSPFVSGPSPSSAAGFLL